MDRLGSVAASAILGLSLPAMAIGTAESVGRVPSTGRPVSAPPTASASLSVHDVFFEAAPPVNQAPAVRVTFSVDNDSDEAITDVALSVAFLTPLTADRPDDPRTLVAGPLTIVSRTTWQAGYRISFDIVFRNLSVDCGCVPSVTITKARFTSDPASIGPARAVRAH